MLYTVICCILCLVYSLQSFLSLIIYAWLFCIHGNLVSSRCALQAVDSRDSVAMALYSQCFSWIIMRINQKIKGKDNFKSIGILDIFGFENFEVKVHSSNLSVISLFKAPENLFSQSASHAHKNPVPAKVLVLVLVISHERYNYLVVSMLLPLVCSGRSLMGKGDVTYVCAPDLRTCQWDILMKCGASQTSTALTVCHLFLL